jgi:hypothetical protein
MRNLGRKNGPAVAITTKLILTLGAVAGRYNFGGHTARPVMVTNELGAAARIKINNQDAAGAWDDATANDFDITVLDGKTVDISLAGAINIKSMGLWVADAEPAAPALQIKGWRSGDT